ncbi:MAG TPA: sugar transferase [Clostridia bacterium]
MAVTYEKALEETMQNLEKISLVTIENKEERKTQYFIEKVEELKPKYFYNFVKRTFDIFSSGLALIVFFIPMIIIAVSIKANSKGPIIYAQERLGRNGKPFKLYKFRSMYIDAEKNGPQWAKEHDNRVTKVGRFLRLTHLDELPQLFNILKGDMSFIGPRPERAVFYEEFETYIHGFKQRLLVKPGLSGWAQVNGGYDLLPEEKIIYDIYYIKNRSLLLDLKCLIKTIGVVFKRRGVR